MAHQPEVALCDLCVTAYLHAFAPLKSDMHTCVMEHEYKNTSVFPTLYDATRNPNTAVSVWTKAKGAYSIYIGGGIYSSLYIVVYFSVFSGLFSRAPGTVSLRLYVYSKRLSLRTRL